MIDLPETHRWFLTFLEQVAAQQGALEFYADETNWRSYQAPRGYEPGPAVDGGERARLVLDGAA